MRRKGFERQRERERQRDLNYVFSLWILEEKEIAIKIMKLAAKEVKIFVYHIYLSKAVKRALGQTLAKRFLDL